MNMPPRVNNKKVKGTGIDKDSKVVDKVDKTTEDNSDDASNSGFGGYLRSEQGIEGCRMLCDALS